MLSVMAQAPDYQHLKGFAFKCPKCQHALAESDMQFILKQFVRTLKGQRLDKHLVKAETKEAQLQRRREASEQGKNRMRKAKEMASCSGQPQPMLTSPFSR